MFVFCGFFFFWLVFLGEEGLGYFFGFGCLVSFWGGLLFCGLVEGWFFVGLICFWGFFVDFFF